MIDNAYLLGGFSISKLDTISYCGNDCNNCELKSGIIANNVDSLFESLFSSGIYGQLKNFVDIVPSFYIEDAVYNFLKDLKENFGNCSGCKNEGMKICDVHNCATKKKVDLCSNCESFDDCLKIKKDSWKYDMLSEIKIKGYDAWSQEI